MMVQKSSIEQGKAIAAQIWPEDEFIYSMFDENVGEYPKAEVRQFIKLLEKAGYEAAYIDDYDPNEFNGNSNTVSLCVFNPVETVKIIDVLKTTGITGNFKQKDGLSADDFEVGEEVSFADNAINYHQGKIIRIVKKGETIPDIKGVLGAVDKPGDPAYKDTLYIKSNGKTYSTTLFAWMKIGKSTS